MLVPYAATLDVPRQVVEYLSRLPSAHRSRIGAPKDSRALGPFRQAVLVLRWFRERGCVHCLARDTAISQATAYRYLHADMYSADPTGSEEGSARPYPGDALLVFGGFGFIALPIGIFLTQNLLFDAVWGITSSGGTRTLGLGGGGGDGGGGGGGGG